MIGAWTVVAIATLALIIGVTIGALVILSLMFGNLVPWRWRDAFKSWRYRTADRIRALLGLPPA